MSSLLEKAKKLRNGSRNNPEVEMIPEDERAKIYDEIEKAVSSGKLRIDEDTFSFIPVKNDVKLPVVINIAAFVLIVLVSILMLAYFKQAEVNIVAGSENVITAESELFSALKKESEEKIKERDTEIAGIREKLERGRGMAHDAEDALGIFNIGDFRENKVGQHNRVDRVRQARVVFISLGDHEPFQFVLPAFVREQGVDSTPAFDDKSAAFLPRLLGRGEGAQLLDERIGGGGDFADHDFVFAPVVQLSLAR